MARSIKMTPRVRQILLNQRERFIKKFGREPGQKDPVFFDPESKTPTPMNTEKVKSDLLQAMEALNIPEAQRQEMLRQLGFD